MGGGGGSREEARRGVKEEKRKQGAEQTANIEIRQITGVNQRREWKTVGEREKLVGPKKG